METFIDGGLFELIVAIFFASFLNFVFRKTYLLVIFSLMIIVCPVVLFFIHKNELYYWLVTMCVLNAGLLIVLLWKEKKKHPGEILFNVETMMKKLSQIRNKVNAFYRK